ncbi:MAG: endonuclease/exonuclease/phosphatase family protein [bacterium]
MVLKFIFVMLLLQGVSLNVQAQDAPEWVLRVASFNVFLNRPAAGALAAQMADGAGVGEADAAVHQIRAVAEIIQRVRPHVILLNEFDDDPSGLALARFMRNHLGVSQNGQPPIEYAYTFRAPSNTGIDSGLDLDGDGQRGGPGDAFGFGAFAGQYGMVLLSQFPILTHKVRTFARFLWRDMPGALLPDNPETPADGDFYTPQQLDVLRLSSKSHWDVPIQIGTRTVHMLAAHPTPPVFDGPEDRNGRRNHDEIRLWADYLGPASGAAYIRDDKGKTGGLEGQRFVVLGDYNADPADGDAYPHAIAQLLQHPAIDSTWVPASSGAEQDAQREGRMNTAHRNPARYDTADLNPDGPGNLRLDYVLPSKSGLTPVDGGVFWPAEEDQTRYLVGSGFPVVSSDHRLVWLDLKIQRGTGVTP